MGELISRIADAPVTDAPLTVYGPVRASFSGPARPVDIAARPGPAR